MTFPPEGTSMHASSFRSLRGKLLFGTLLLSPITSLAQSDSKTFGSNYFVSVQDLKMAGKARAAFDKGSRLLEKGETARSLAYLEKAIAQFPEHYIAYYDLGVAYFRLGQTADAEQAFQKAIDLTGGGFAPPQFGIGAILCKQHQFAQAAKIVQRGLEREPGSAIGKFYLGWAQLALNQVAEAERTLQQALFLEPHFAEARTLLEKLHQQIDARRNAAQVTAASAKP
jgi:Tfp pilus assembly protein PilF